MHLPPREPVVTLYPRRRSYEPEAKVASLCLAGLVLLALLASLLGCRPSPSPGHLRVMESAQWTVTTLERIDGAIVVHELVLRERGLGGRR